MATITIRLSDYAQRCYELYRVFELEEVRDGIAVADVVTLEGFATSYYISTLGHIGGHYLATQKAHRFEFTLRQFVAAVKAL